MGEFDAIAAAKELRLRHARARAEKLLHFIDFTVLGPPYQDEHAHKQPEFEAKIHSLFVDTLYAAEVAGFTVNLGALVDAAQKIYEVDRS